MNEQTEISENGSQDQATNEPGIKSVYNYLVFGLSIPERTLRSTAAMVGGVLHESAELLVPNAFRDSRSYQTFVQQMLDMLAKDVGGAHAESADAEANSSEPDADQAVAATENDEPRADKTDPSQVENFVARKTVGSFLDLAGMATFHLSPLTILAIVSDVAHGSKIYLHELAAELKREGIVSQDSTIDSASDLLEAISTASGETAAAFDLPPLSVEGLRETIQRTQDNITEIDAVALMPEAEIQRLWTDIKSMAESENVSMFDISSAMTMYTLNRVGTVGKGALTTVRVTGRLLDDHLIDHYWQGLSEIGQRGVYGMLSDVSQPYFEAVYYNYSMHRPTVTEDIVSGKMAGQIWRGFHGWLMGDDLDDNQTGSTSKE